ncbi:MAG: alginate lyase family protein [Congregibacter sp.]
MNKLPIVLCLLLSLSIPTEASSQAHPKLILTEIGVKEIRMNLGRAPLFDASVEKARREVDAEIAMGIDTPIPKDFSGGYTHERHKRNFVIAQKAGALFQILQQEKYAEYLRDMLFQYEAMYQDLPVHPKERSYARGKLFWQCLNDSNWLLYMAQAYDAIYDWLPEQERERLNNNLFRPFADFISLGNPQFFNRVHNHSAWGNAAVGMIGLVMGDDDLVHRALYGIPDDQLGADLKDDDGGFIKREGQKVGFLANLEEPFSPDGYYTEGPYYQRYAMYPFLMFALAMHNVKPEAGVLEYKDRVLLTAVDALLNLSDADGEFFPLNDAQKGMSYFSQSLVTAVDVAFHYGERDPGLLDIAINQGQVLLDQAGLSVALAVRDGEAKPFTKSSINLRDGPLGKQGGVAILRQGKEDLALIFKYSAQGLSHGHYDKLSFSLSYDGDEVVQDYGLVRFVNIEQKGGGNYLPENSTWAKQSIAHNALVQNQSSHFSGSYEQGSRHHSDLHVFDVSASNVQVVSAREHNAYPGTKMLRTMALINLAKLEKPFVLDMMKVMSEARNQYDLPFYFMGQVIEANYPYDAASGRTTLGDANGYQHLYLEAKGSPATESSQFTWLLGGRFFTLTSATKSDDEWLFVRLGANDPAFNLRRDAGLILRRKDAQDTVFASVIEPHGRYSPVSELSENPRSNVSGIKVLFDNESYTAVAIEGKGRPLALFIIANQEASTSTRHQLSLGSKVYRWKGPYYFADQS